MLNLEKKVKVLVIDRFFMYLSLLRNGFTTRMLSRSFDISKSTESRYLVTWTNLYFFLLENLWFGLQKSKC